MEQDESPGLSLFEGFGVELEYVIVARSSELTVQPVADRLLEAAAGRLEAEVEMGELSWSNELVLHVIELKTNGPAPSLAPLAEFFQRDVSRMDQLLAPLGATLLPTAMHPFMDPTTETRLWPHDYGEVYRTFNRMFDCRGHGWSNLQSAHLNLPYQGDDEFGRLHAAIRLVLPLLPALAASSPIVEGRLTGACDNRILYYRDNCARIPCVTGAIIPERAYTRADYQREILDPIAEAVAPHDTDEVLDPEWVNARGAIARFCRDSIEIRLLDVQECPRADLAILSLVTALLRGLAEERWCSSARQRQFEVDRLSSTLLRCAERGSGARIDDAPYLDALGIDSSGATARGIWERVMSRLSRERLLDADDAWLSHYLAGGTLSERMLSRLGSDHSRACVTELYRELSGCLLAGQLFP